MWTPSHSRTDIHMSMDRTNCGEGHQCWMSYWKCSNQTLESTEQKSVQNKNNFLNKSCGREETPRSALSFRTFCPPDGGQIACTELCTVLWWFLTVPGWASHLLDIRCQKTPEPHFVCIKLKEMHKLQFSPKTYLLYISFCVHHEFLSKYHYYKVLRNQTSFNMLNQDPF